MTAAHVIIEAAIIVGLATLAIWLARELARFCDREIRRHIDCALGDRFDVFPDDDWPCTYGEHMDAVYSAVPCPKCSGDEPARGHIACTAVAEQRRALADARAVWNRAKP